MQADLYNPAATAPNANTRAFNQNLQRLKLDVQRSWASTARRRRLRSSGKSSAASRIYQSGAEGSSLRPFSLSTARCQLQSAQRVACIEVSRAYRRETVRLGTSMNDMTATPTLWNLADLYPTAEAWAAEYARIKAAATALDFHSGKIGTNAAAMLAALDAMSRVSRETARLYTYAALKADEDLSLSKNQERRQQAGALYTLLGEKTAWLAPEILALGEAKSPGLRTRERDARQAPRLFPRQHAARRAAHAGHGSGSVLAAAGDVLQQPDSVYGQLANSELPFPTITLSNGASVRLDQSGYVQYRQSENRADRKLVFDNFWGAWKSYEGTAGACSPRRSWAISSAPRRASTRTRSRPRSFPTTCRRPSIARWSPRPMRACRRCTAFSVCAGKLARDRRAARILRRLSDHVPRHPRAEIHGRRFRARHARCARPLWRGISRLPAQGFAGNWTDPFPRQHKASGAYMNGAPTTCTPICCSTTRTITTSLSTFAHEWGHAVHTLLLDEAPALREVGLLDLHRRDRLDRERDAAHAHGEAREDARGEAVLSRRADGESSAAPSSARRCSPSSSSRSTRRSKRARPLSGERMTELYLRHAERYHGEAEGVMKIDRAYGIEWAYIPHFYCNFYVYQYATSIAGAARFADAIIAKASRRRNAFWRCCAPAARTIRTRSTSGRHRHGVAGALPRADRAHEPAHGRDRSAAALAH